jgi:hypothetical protein
MTDKRNELTTELSEKAAANQKKMQAMIDAIAITDPKIKERLTVAAAWQFMNLPDSVFGWNAEKKEHGKTISTGPMPFEVKALCVITTLQLGLIPGTGAVTWMGSKIYIGAHARRDLANTGEHLFIMGRREHRGFNEFEKRMFGWREGDHDLVIEQPAIFRGNQIVAIGYGMISHEEILKGQQYNIKCFLTAKNIGMTLLTRAERDLYTRFNPMRGIDTGADEDAENGNFSQTANISPEIIEAEAKITRRKRNHDEKTLTMVKPFPSNIEAEKERHKDALNRFWELEAEITDADEDPLKILEIDSLEDIEYWSVEEIKGATERLFDALEAKKLPEKTEKKPEAKTQKIQKAEAEPPKKRAEPAKAAAMSANAVTSPASAIPRALTPEQIALLNAPRKQGRPSREILELRKLQEQIEARNRAEAEMAGKEKTNEIPDETHDETAEESDHELPESIDTTTAETIYDDISHEPEIHAVPEDAGDAWEPEVEAEPEPAKAVPAPSSRPALNERAQLEVKAAYDKVRSMLNIAKDQKLREKLEDLLNRDLEPSDHQQFGNIIRKARIGDYRELDDLIKSRPYKQ